MHWTFVIYLAAIGALGLLSGGAQAAIAILGLLLAVFACVLAHEFGHILVARRFGIRTPDVTLLPIGGVARLQRIPERPAQEFAVAIAGPLVNFAIAGGLYGLLGVAPSDLATAPFPSVRDILPDLVTINLFLGLFNLLPAFPMDGGRILRAALSVITGRVRATQIAAAIGQALAIGFGLLGLLFGHVILILVAVFVYLAAGAEAQDVRMHQLVGPLRVADVITSDLRPLFASNTLNEAAHAMLQTGQRDFPVLDEYQGLIGVLSRENLLKAIGTHSRDTPISKVTESNWHQVCVEDRVETVLPLAEADSMPIVATDRDGRFAGLLTLGNLIDVQLLAVASAPAEGHRTGS